MASMPASSTPRVVSVASQGVDGLDLLKVAGAGAGRAGVFAVLGDSWWSPGEEEFGSLQTVFGTRRIREFNQRQWDLSRTRLNQLAAVRCSPRSPKRGRLTPCRRSSLVAAATGR